MITSTLFSPLGDWIALACSNLGQLVVWEWQSQTYVLKQQGHFNNMTQLTYSPDGMHIASGGDDGKVISHSLSFAFGSVRMFVGDVDQTVEHDQWILFCDILGTFVDDHRIGIRFERTIHCF